MPSRPEYSVNESNFAKLFRQHFKLFSNEFQMPSRYLHWVFKVSASCSKFQQHKIEVSLEMTGLLCQWTPVANHSISIAKQSSAQQCWSILACVASQNRTPHDKPGYL